jgi:hypothetical protein
MLVKHGINGINSLECESGRSLIGIFHSSHRIIFASDNEMLRDSSWTNQIEVAI